MSRVAAPFFSRLFRNCDTVRIFTKVAKIQHLITRILIVPAMLVLFLGACAMEGDFGRPRPTVWTKMTDEVLLNTDMITRGLNRPELNRDEIVMREAGHRLMTPLNFVPQALDAPLSRPYDRYDGKYTPSQSDMPMPLIARELEKDHHALTQFGDAARRVLRTYDQQMMSLLRYDPVLRAKRRDEARFRMQENFDYIESVFADFGHRLQAYHYAIEEARVNEPDVIVVEVEGSLRHLRDRSASLEYELTHYFGNALARGEYPTPRFATREPQRFERGLSRDPYPDHSGGYSRQRPPPMDEKTFK